MHEDGAQGEIFGGCLMGATSTTRRALLAGLASTLSGCCMFVPCHPGLRAHGHAMDVSTGKPLDYASITVFGARFRTDTNGCVKFALADGLPFTFDVTRTGYKPLASTPPRGYFELDIELAPEGSAQAGAVTWKASTEARFNAAPACF